MKPATAKTNHRLARIDWRYRGSVHGKKGPTESRYSLRARQILARRMPGGERWRRIKDLGKQF
jgi:hypothetical protein